jgi:hypothetical protein
MAEETWFVAMDGRQLEGARPLNEVKEIIRANTGKRIVVWNEKMTGWADPATLPAFREAAASAPPPAPASAAAPPPEPPASVPPPRRDPGAAAGAVAAAVAGSAPAAKAMIQHEARFFRGLLDFKFEEFITPKVIRTLYIVSLIFVALGFVAMVFGGIGMIFMGARFGGGGSAILGIVYLVLSPVIALLQATFLRMFFELVLVLFRIKDAIVNLEESSHAKP